MHYISTRGDAPPRTFTQAVMEGLAPDGGLFLPAAVPDVSHRLAELRGLSFQHLFQELVTPFMDDAVAPQALREMTARSYAVFSDPQVTPVRQVAGIHVCELFHGPTLAFKDVALQFLGNLFEHLLARREARLTVLGATSGDTGSAAIQALRGRRGIEVFILYPQGRVSPMQELQMTTVPDANVHPIAIEGSFDDAQALVKALFNDHAFNAEVSLGAINSINWARVMAQITYFFHAYFQVLEARGDAMALGDPVRFSVPTGNFGHIYAGRMARRMGLPVDKLILATNDNAILHTLVAEGAYVRGEVVSTFSPSMDIQVASNFERYLFDLADGNPAQVRDWLQALERNGGFALTPAEHDRVREDFASERVSDAETVETVRAVHAETGYLLDPHSAIGYRAAQRHEAQGVPTITMATAHPAKFSAAIRQAIGHEPALPPALAGLTGLPEKKLLLPPDPKALRQAIRQALSGQGHSAE